MQTGLIQAGGEGLPWGCLTRGSGPGSPVAQEQELLSIVLLLHSSPGAPAPRQGMNITSGVWHGAAGKHYGSAYNASPKGRVSRLGERE